ncbi:MAG: type II toxin-antitoxin system Phd/YefM family antitoxin [Brevundimonas sp.]|jgi:prevent-host-death family protein
METVNIHQAKTHLSRLIEKAAKGESFIIAKAGKPMVKVTAIEETPQKAVQRIGFMKGEGVVPDDIKTPFKDEIEDMFYGRS